jgi:choline dehydrogenase-like flavoprotein
MSDADAVVVGSGAGGGAIALALTRAGMRVVCLERGRHYREPDFIHDELAICRRSFFTPDALRDPHVVVRPNGSAERSADGWIACCVGGGTVHMSGYFFRMTAQELRDWPLSPGELTPHYEEVEKILGISGEGQPLAPLLAHPAAALVEGACRKAGLRAFPIPRAIISADYDGRRACQYCGFCGSYGCEVGAKSSSLVTFLAKAAATGRLELRAQAKATRITTNGNGRADGVEWIDAGGALHKTQARVVVVACSAIETARLLLSSKVGNASGLIGKNLMFATVAAGWARFDRGAPHFPDGAEQLPFIDRTVQLDGGTIIFNRPHFNPIFQAERLAARNDGPPLYGMALKKRMREFFLETQTIEWETISSFQPHDRCTVDLDPDVKDPHGLPVARFRPEVHPASLEASDRLAARARSILASEKPRSSGDHVDDRTYLFLQAGTARMGRDPHRSVVEPSGQSHQVKNLYIADASSFPSIGGAPFTLTIMANALRIGAGIVARGKKGDL